MADAELAPAAEDQEELEDGPVLELVAEPGRAARVRAELRPYLPTREALAAALAGVGPGSRVLIGRGWAWAREDPAFRFGGSAFGGYVAVTALPAAAGPYAPWLLPAAGVAWCVAARLNAPTPGASSGPGAAPAGKGAEPCAEGEGSGDCAPPEPVVVAEAPPRTHLVALVHSVAGTSDSGTGAHLADVLAAAQRSGELAGWDQAALRAEIESWGVPVEEKLKLKFNGRQSVRQGVRVRDLPALLQAVPDPAGEEPPPGPAASPPPGPAAAPAEPPVQAAPAAPAEG
ncbi:hypothetical protein [Streptomyces sp. NPDC089919]|uniref:hypothetical protein n=1 Tax=Streptomyces sp. NPDC089919 TaxID=3155188 RepID=UPI00342AED2A